MKNNGPVYNITTGKFEYPLDDYTAIDTQGHISMRVDAYTSISPYSVKNNQVNSFDYEIHPKKPAGSSGENVTFWQGVGVLAVIGVMAALVYYGLLG